MVWLRVGKKSRRRVFGKRAAVCALCIISELFFWLMAGINGHSPTQQDRLVRQTQAEVDHKNAGCVSCHASTDEPTMHPTRTVRLACTDCHGGDSTATLSSVTSLNSSEHEE